MSMCEEENESIMWVVDKTGLPCNWWLQENTLVECKVGCVCVCVWGNKGNLTNHI